MVKEEKAKEDLKQIEAKDSKLEKSEKNSTKEAKKISAKNSEKTKDKKQVKAVFYDVIRRPVVTEKSTNISSESKIVFEISPRADKKSVKKSVEALFAVNVLKVNIINVRGKRKVFRGVSGNTNGYKKAIVTLADGQSVDLASGI